jgi:hypothetical protein
MGRVVKILSAFDPSSDELVGEWTLRVDEGDLRESFGLEPGEGWVGEYDVGPDQAVFLQPLVADPIDLDSFAYQLGDRDPNSLLAKALDGYLEADPQAREEPLGELCSALSWRATGLLEEVQAWLPEWWIDGVFVERATGDTDEALDLRGTMLVCDLDRSFVEPFEARLRRGRTGRDVRLELRLGDAATGFGCVPFGDRRPRRWQEYGDWQIDEWIFAVETPPLPSGP